MHIDHVTLSRYKGLALSNIKTLSITVTTDISLILGSNGSGKSSLLKELSPLPAIAGDYHEGGYKQIALVHNGVSYTLRTDIKRSAKHSFIRDGEELNSGGTASVQKDLVEFHLGYTPIVHRILLGNFHFTQATPQVRRDILTSISNLNLSYANGLWERLRTAHRDKVGAIKHLSQKQRTLETDLLSLGEVDSLAETAQALQLKVRQLLPLSLTTEVNVLDYKFVLDKAVESLEGVTQVYLKQRRYIDRLETTDYNTLIAKITEYDKALHLTRSEISRIAAELDKATELTQVLNSTEGGLGTLETRLADRIQQQSKLQCQAGIEYSGSLSDICNDLELVSKTLYELHTATQTDILECDRSTLKSDYSKLEGVKGEILKVEAGIRRLETHIHHGELSQQAIINCPQCKTAIAPEGAVSVERLANYKVRLAKGRTLLETLETQRNTLESQVALEQGYWDYIDQYGQCLQHTPRLIPFWNTLSSVRQAATQATQTDTLINAELQRVRQIKASEQLSMEITALKDSIKIHKIAEESSPTQRKQQLETELNQCYRRENEQVDLLKQYRLIERDYNRLKTLHETTETLTEAAGTALAEWINAEGYHQVGQTINSLQTQLGLIQTTLNRRSHIKDQIATVTEELKILERESTALSALVKTLSPKEGLIAEQMSGMVNVFMNQVNEVITQVWEYTLAIGESGLEERGLDYKFPLIVEEVTVPEISDASKGQQAMIDLAFTLVVIGYLGMENYPLYLDEVGSAFDTVHQTRLLDYIKTLVSSGHCGQLFMVNHYSEMYGGLSNADIIVLSENNIMVPDRYNENVTITHH